MPSSRERRLQRLLEALETGEVLEVQACDLNCPVCPLRSVCPLSGASLQGGGVRLRLLEARRGVAGGGAR